MGEYKQIISMPNFEWVDMNDNSWEDIKREEAKSSETVLATNAKGSILVGRISKSNDDLYGYVLSTYLGGGFNNVTRFVKIEKLLKD